MRKVKVNAQVTFVIYLLESVANFSIFVGWFFIFQKNDDSSLVLGIFWYHIILPYTFLMNTSHNKNLVLDDGWGNTIRNTLGLPENINVFSALSLHQFIPRKNQTTIKEIDKNDKIDSQDPKTNATEMDLRNDPRSQNISGQNSNLEIPTISKSVESASLKEEVNTINVPDSEPSTSKKLITDNQGEKPCPPSRKTITDSDDEDDDALNLQRSDHLIIGEEILSYMMKYLDREQGYLHYLKELSKFNESFIHDANTINNFRIAHLTDFPTLNKNHVKGSLKEKRNRCRRNKSVDSKHRSKFRDSVDESKDYGGTTEKIKIRKKLLERYLEFCCDEESFNSLVGLIFDIEETMTEE